MKIDVIAVGELGEGEVRRWRDIQRGAPALGNPFMSPEFTRAVGRFNPASRVAVLHDGAGVAGFFPHERGALGVGGPIGAGLTDCQGLIAPPDLELDVRALLRACRLTVWEFDHLLAEQKALAPYHAFARVEPVMDLSDGFDPYIDAVRQGSPKTFKTVRYKERKLGREVGEIEYTFADDDPAMLRLLMDLKSAQYRRTGRNDRFAQPWIVALVEHLHATGVGVLSVLRAGGRPVSLHLGLRGEDRMAGWFPAYDAAYGRYSPGMIGHLRLAEGAADAGITEVAMGRGGREYKDWLKNGEFPIAEGRLTRPSVRAAAHWVKDAPLRTARDAALRNPRLYKQADRVLKRYARLRGTADGPAEAAE